MTTQMVSPLGDSLMLLEVVVILVLVVWSVVELAHRRRQSVLRRGRWLLGAVLLYTGALTIIGLASSPGQLKSGDTKCFDDWCAAMTGAQRDPATGRLLVEVRLENRGRRSAMRSDLARAYLEVPGRGLVAPRSGDPLQTLIKPGEPVEVELAFDVPARTSGARFVVAEGSDTVGPGTITIGDEASPFHARAGWPLATS